MTWRSKSRFWCAPMMMLCALVVGCANPLTNVTDTPGPIRRAEYLAVDGAKLFVVTRGTDRHAPVVLWLHGGPGGPERPLFRYFNGDLEQHVVVAYWDQRGAGRSFDPKADPHLLTIARHLVDLDAVVDHLRASLGQDTIVLIGHSWGAALGLLYVQQHPEKVSAFIGVAPLVSLLKAQQAQYAFVSTEAARRKDGATLTRVREIGLPPHVSVDQQLAMEDLADQYGAVFHTQPCKTCVVIRGMLTGLVTPWELMSIHRGMHASLKAMTPELLRLNLERAVPRVDVPVWFFLGRYDRHVDSTIAADYFETLRAPSKQLIWFEHSAHNVPFEEPAWLHDTVVSIVQSIRIRCQRPCMYAAAIDRLSITRSARDRCAVPVLATGGGGPVSESGSAPHHAINPDLMRGGYAKNPRLTRRFRENKLGASKNRESRWGILGTLEQ